MKPIDSTAEMLTFKMMGYPVDKRWVDWAYDMLVAGFDTEKLVLLAGELEPYDQVELSVKTDKLFKELGLDWHNRELVLKRYSCYLFGKAIDDKTKPITVLKSLKDIYLNDE